MLVAVAYFLLLLPVLLCSHGADIAFVACCNYSQTGQAAMAAAEEQSVSEESPVWRVQFCISGFGAFAGVRSNPTLRLANEIRGHIESNPLPGCSTLLAASEFPVCATGMPTSLEELVDSCGSLPSDTTRVFLHFGVASIDRIHIERTAFNDASFRAPDNSGNMPQRQPVCATEPLDARRHTALPVEAITAALANDGHPVAVSDDAGRFLCNYTLYHSLARCHPLHGNDAGAAPRASCEEQTALFVHVPPHSIVSSAQLLDFASALMSEMGRRISRAGGLAALQSKATRTLYKLPKPSHGQQSTDSLRRGIDDGKSGVAGAPAASSASPPAAPTHTPPPADPRIAAAGSMLQDLEDMGFVKEHALAALHATHYRSIDEALDWTVEHPPGDAVPPPALGAAAEPSSKPSSADIQSEIDADSRLQRAAVSSSAAIAEATLQAAAGSSGPPPHSFAPPATQHSDASASLASMLSQWSFDLKLVLLVRKDLGMSVGKVAAQCSHAAIAAATKGDHLMNAQWQDAGEKIVVLGVQDSEEVRTLSAKARGAGLQVHAITDAGRTEVAPGTQTVTAIGPAFAAALDQVTGHLRTL